jgi:hypothetical protein
MSTLDQLKSKIQKLLKLEQYCEDNNLLPDDLDFTLEDVLRALKGKEYEHYITFDGDDLAHIYEIVCNIGEDGNAEIEPAGVYWQLGKPLDSQSSETIEWLNKIIN